MPTHDSPAPSRAIAPNRAASATGVLLSPVLPGRRTGAAALALGVALGTLLGPGASEATAQALEPLSRDLKKLSLEELLDLEVTSVSKRPEKLRDAAAAIQVVTGEDIRRSGAANIPEALRLAGNLHVAQKGSHAWGVSARGFNTELANKLLVLMDGRTVYTPLFSGVFWNRQDYLLEDLERIEVISGPGGTLWGSNAVNGVINITSKSARETQGWFLETGGGSQLEGFVGVRYGGRVADNMHFRVYGKHFDRGSEVFSNGQDANDDWHQTQGGFRFDAGSSARDLVTVQGDIYGGRERVTTGGTARTGGGNVLLRWSRVLSASSDLSLQLYYDRTHLALPTPAFVINGLTLAPAGVLVDDLDTYDLDFQHRFGGGTRHHLVWGMDYRIARDRLTNSPSLGFLPAALDTDQFSAFVQDELALSSKVSLTLGTKFEQTHYTGWETEPNVRLHWELPAEQVVWAAVSRAIRAPSRIDRDLRQPMPPNLVVLAGSPAFESETLLAYEAGYRVQPHPDLAVSLSVFHHRYENLRSTSLTPATVIPFFFANNLEAETQGFELRVDQRVNDRWRWSANYNFLDEDVRVVAGRSDLNNALNETADPRHQISVRSSFTLTGRLELDAGFRWVDSFQINRSAAAARVESYHELDLCLRWQATEALEISAVGRNLLHSQHAEYGAPAGTRGEISRSYHARAAWRF